MQPFRKGFGAENNTLYKWPMVNNGDLLDSQKAIQDDNGSLVTTAPQVNIQYKGS